MNKLRRAALLLAFPLMLAACGERSAPGSVSNASSVDREFGIPASQAPTIDAASRFAQGFETGNLMSARKVYVFFDPQCPHCALFWKEAKVLEKDARFVWVPVGILNKKSSLQAATILSAPNPAQTMEAHEGLILAQKGGILPTENLDPTVMAAVAKNSRLLASFGADSVPYLVTVTADGKPWSGNGMPAQALAAVLGWRAGSVPSPTAAAGAPGKTP